MSKSSKQLIAIFTVLMTTLTACGSKGGGTSASPPPAAASAAPVQDCTNPDPATGFCGGVGNAGYIGIGEWTGFLNVNDPNAYRQFLSENKMCYGYECEQSDNKFKLAIETINTHLPGKAQFVLHSLRTGGGGRYMARLAKAAFTADNTGIQLAYYPFGMNNQNWNNSCPGNGNTSCNGNSSPIALRIIAHFTQADKTQMDVQVFYRGVQIGSGHMVINGQFLQFDPNMNNGGDQQYTGGHYGQYGCDYDYFFGKDLSLGWHYQGHNNHHYRPRHHYYRHDDDDNEDHHLRFSFGFSNGGLSAFGNYNGNL